MRSPPRRVPCVGRRCAASPTPALKSVSQSVSQLVRQSGPSLPRSLPSLPTLAPYPRSLPSPTCSTPPSLPPSLLHLLLPASRPGPEIGRTPLIPLTLYRRVHHWSGMYPMHAAILLVWTGSPTHVLVGIGKGRRGLEVVHEQRGVCRWPVGAITVAQA